MFCIGIIIFIILATIAIIKIWLKWVITWDRSRTCLVGKTAIITGANQGIGYYTALDFAKRGARVILACRSEEKAVEARNKIIITTGNTNVVWKHLDLSDLSSVREFAKNILSTEERLDILVNNAGVIGAERRTTKDGHDYYMQVNYLGHFLLTILLTGLLKKTTPSRVVNLASIVARQAILDPNNFNASTKGSLSYSNSKLCMILFTRELAKKLKSSGVEVNSVHPGFVRTDIFQSMPGRIKMILAFLSKYFFRSAEEGAQTSIYVAVSPDIKGTTGEYFDNCAVAWMPSMPEQARDEALAKNVWAKSEEIVGLTPEERKFLD